MVIGQALVRTRIGVNDENHSVMTKNRSYCLTMKHGCVSGLEWCRCVSRLRCECGTQQFLKKVGADIAGLGD